MICPDLLILFVVYRTIGRMGHKPHEKTRLRDIGNKSPIVHKI